MDMERTKFIKAQQRKSVHLQKNTEEKVLEKNATTWLNKMCRLNHLD
jgi:hypothetical protein